MNQLTAANLLTVLRMLLIPPFAILLLYGHRGWALVVFLAAGITDLLDGLIARWTGQKTTLGAWLDPMADKLLLVTTFIVLTLPGLGLANRLPIWLTVLIISRDVVIVLTVAIISLATAAHQAWSANLYTLPSDMFPRKAVGSVIGIGGTAGAIGGMIFSLYVGQVLERIGTYSLIFYVAGSVYLIALAIMHWLVPRLEQAEVC